MNLEDVLVDLSVSALREDQRSVRTIVLTACRLLKKTHPDRAKLIASALVQKDAGTDPLRAVGMMSIPSDQESQLSLASIEPFIPDEEPIFEEALQQRVQRFLEQHMAGDKLLKNGIAPPSSILLVGEPGVGKTLLAKYIAKKTGRQLVALDLAAAVSSLFGKTGQNLKRVLSYAREHSTVLLLDEFDAIAKRRDDVSDLGELKRIVNVLLKELES